MSLYVFTGAVQVWGRTFLQKGLTQGVTDKAFLPAKGSGCKKRSLRPIEAETSFVIYVKSIYYLNPVSRPNLQDRVQEYRDRGLSVLHRQSPRFRSR